MLQKFKAGIYNDKCLALFLKCMRNYLSCFGFYLVFIRLLNYCRFLTLDIGLCYHGKRGIQKVTPSFRKLYFHNHYTY
jgi:hypothetical protein